MFLSSIDATKIKYFRRLNFKKLSCRVEGFFVRSEQNLDPRRKRANETGEGGTRRSRRRRGGAPENK